MGHNTKLVGHVLQCAPPWLRHCSGAVLDAVKVREESDQNTDIGVVEYEESFCVLYYS